MSDSEKLKSVTQELHARISRLELTQLAMIKSMSVAGTLPPTFAAMFKEDVSVHVAAVADEAFKSNLSRNADQWVEVFEALTREPLKR